MIQNRWGRRGPGPLTLSSKTDSEHSRRWSRGTPIAGWDGGHGGRLPGGGGAGQRSTGGRHPGDPRGSAEEEDTTQNCVRVRRSLGNVVFIPFSLDKQYEEKTIGGDIILASISSD